MNSTWDYIIVGSGAAGIPLADRLSESGKSVLLLERGWASSRRYGGQLRPAWLEGSNLTRFDIPGLYTYIWANHTENQGILCPDYSVPASCVLGGGTAINGGLWWKPTKDDWDTVMPPGFQSTDLAPAVSRAFARIPWTDTPSQDGKLYHFFINGERGGPMATYLLSASQKKNFELKMNTTVTRVLRKPKDVTGVEVEESGPGGVSGIINLNPKGKVILSAGVFGTSKILFRSGIGPKDQLEIVKSAEGDKLVDEKDWIDLPVGKLLDDGPAITIAITKPGLETYDWEAAYNTPIPEDAKSYLKSRSGALAQIEPSIGPIFWDEVKGEDGKTRVVQWNSNTVNSEGVGSIIAFTNNLNLGKTARGRLTINSSLKVNVSIPPFYNDEGDHDFKAILSSTKDLVSIIQNISNATFFMPPPDTDLETYLRQSATPSPSLTSNHWVGSTQMRSSCSDPSAVIDTTTTVCGTSNLHIVDAGIINGVPAANPQAAIVSIAERASEIILGLK
ncbi:GMC oxidoreductase [Zopfia rhizophila CBS 207.26]|uniref:GMC oxidoreductase n=1 Tax=Zopfia rhizophila CBS 207.26 TaxID=1314779 RepID=A0A6A6DMR5_9PEZI|nr:GMC oxidoreductase [Zopfia rhizophila CBS 207.26]